MRILLSIFLISLTIWSIAQVKPETEAYEFPYGDLADTSRGVFGDDNRKEVKDATEYHQLVRATAVMVHKDKIRGNKIYSETLRSRLSRKFNTDSFHENVKFLDQPTCATCTGFLIAPDILVTAGHCIEKLEDAKNYVWVFDYTLEKNYNAFAGYITIDTADIYSVTEVMGAYFQSLSTYTDYSFLRLNKKSSREPYHFRTSGKVANYSNVYTIGSPTGLPLKLADNAWVVNNSYESWFRNSIDGFPGNSGGPVFNEYGLIEGIHVRGAVELAGKNYTGDYKFDSTCNCVKTVQWSSTWGTEGSHAHRITAVPTELLHEALYGNFVYAIDNGDMERLEDWLAYSWFTNSEMAQKRGRFEFMVAEKNNLEMLKLILDHSLNPRVVDSNGKSLLFYAMNNDNEEMLRYLLRKGVSPNKRDNQENLVLTEAIRQSKIPIARALIERGANVNAIDHTGENALHIAARTWSVEWVGMIIAKGGDYSIKNEQGWDAIKIARKSKNKDVKRYLKLVKKGKLPSMISI